ncbi:MAG: amidase [Kofleriaceae bacterium]|nr:amidase [Kofleriaceae bacterium]
MSHKPEPSQSNSSSHYNLSACEIHQGLQDGSLTSAEIVASLIERRKSTDDKLNSFVAECDDAMQNAEAADSARKQGKIAGPLHGMPMTIKDSVDLEGYDSTMGIRSRVGKPAKQDAVLVRELRRQSAIFLGKTNIPQALLAQETESEVYGVCNNPWDTNRTPGGSSGGEAAAVSAGLSPLGIGTDIGGSIRMPAHFCGIVGFKPTLDTWSNRGSNGPIPGQETVRAQIGCLTRTVADCDFLWRAVGSEGQAKGDPNVRPFAHKPAPDLRGMTIGIVDGDEYFQPCDTIKRAIRISKAALEEAGATVVSYTPVASRDIISTWIAALTSDGAKTMMKTLGPDKVIQQLKPSMQLLKLPRLLKASLRGIMKAKGEGRIAMLFDIIGEKSVAELWALTNRRTELRLAEFDAWNQQGIDVVVCPPHVVPAMQHGTSGDFALSLASMFRWTLFNFPAGVVPVTSVQKGETGYMGTDRLAKRAISILKGSEGMPVGVQVVARPFHEEKLLAVMASIEADAKTRDGFPHTPVEL